MVIGEPIFPLFLIKKLPHFVDLTDSSPPCPVTKLRISSAVALQHLDCLFFMIFWTPAITVTFQLALTER